MHLLRTHRFELFLAVLAAVELATVAAAQVADKPAALIVTALSVLVLLGWRVQPLAVSLAAFAALTLSFTVMPRSTVAQFFGALVTFAVAGAINRQREALVAWLAGAGMLAYSAWVNPFGGGTPDFLLSLAFCTAMWSAGVLVAQRGRHVAQALTQARDAEAASDARMRQAVTDERAAIARELHDVVSHGLSVVVVQSVAARSLLADVRDPAADTVDRHLEAVEASARDALAEMRRMLGLLRSFDDVDAAATAPPTPGLRHLDELVERVTGGRGQVHWPKQLVLSAGLELAVYRITQEALTNVLKHAPGATVAVSVAEDDDHVTVQVRNGPSTGPILQGPVGAGRGLVGARERVALYGGTLEVTPTAEGGFCLIARFPALGIAQLSPGTSPTPPAIVSS